jgi:hypothetical protein
VVKNITLHGYGQYAYQMGGGRISASPDAPEKYMAANDLTRIYDLEHDRFQMRERRNMLFPFLGPFGHSFALNDNRIGGDGSRNRGDNCSFDIVGAVQASKRAFCNGSTRPQKPGPPPFGPAR